MGFKPDVPGERFQPHVLQRPPELHPHSFDVVGGNSDRQVPLDLEAAVTPLVADGFVVEPEAFQPVVTAPLIRVDCRSRHDILTDELLGVAFDLSGRTKNIVFFSSFLRGCENYLDNCFSYATSDNA